jgi:uncharacterized protein (DUF433 family)
VEPLEEDRFWDDCDLVHRDPEIMHGQPVLWGTRLTPDTLVENVEAYMELRGMTEDQAMEATLKSFPGTPGGKETLQKLLDYQEARLHQSVP